MVGLVSREAYKHGLSETLVLGLILVESLGNPQAVSLKDARGLMQVIPPTGQFIAASLSEKWRGVPSLHEVETSIRFGTWYLSYLQQIFPNNEQATLAAYNWGPDHIRFRLRVGRPLPEEYPILVWEAKTRIEESMYAYYNASYWRGFHLPGDLTSHRIPHEPQNSSRH